MTIPSHPNLSHPHLHRYIIYRCVIGSRVYGLSRDDSDTDRRGIYLPPADVQWSLAGAPEQLEDRGNADTYWELQKFLNLALKANPNVLEVLHSPAVEYADDVAQELLAMRSIFLSKRVYQTFSGYAESQFRKIGQDLRTTGEIKWKHAMHLIRLLISGINAVREGTIVLDVGPHRDALLQIRDGLMKWEDVEAWRLRLQAEFEAASAMTTLPDLPDYNRANAFLIRARRKRAAD